MKIWMWWPLRFLKWIQGLSKTRCDLLIGLGPSKDQPFCLIMGCPDKNLFFWNMDLSEDGMAKLIINLQSRLDLYQELKKGNL